MSAATGHCRSAFTPDRRCGFSAYLLQRLLRRKLLSVELCALSAQLGLEVLWAKAANRDSLAYCSKARHSDAPKERTVSRAASRCRSCARTRQRSAAT
jgi:hypothetical protein